MEKWLNMGTLRLRPIYWLKLFFNCDENPAEGKPDEV